MSNLPDITDAVTVELNSQLAEKTYQAIQYKALAEALLKERDELQSAATELETNRPISGTVVGE